MWCSCRNGKFCPPVPMHNSTPSATGTAGANATLSLLNLHTPLPFNSDLASPSTLGTKTPSHRTGTVVSDDSARSGEEGRRLGVGTKQHQAQAHLAPAKEGSCPPTQLRPGKGPAPLSLPLPASDLEHHTKCQKTHNGCSDSGFIEQGLGSGMKQPGNYV